MWPEKNLQMSINVSQKWFHLKNDRFLTPLQKLPKSVEDLGKLIKNLPKSNKSPNLVTLKPKQYVWTGSVACADCLSSFARALLIRGLKTLLMQLNPEAESSPGHANVFTSKVVGKNLQFCN